jgi:mannose-1-phosphate guanylyltransferase
LEDTTSRSLSTQIEALKNAGVVEVILAINYQPEVMMGFINEWQEKLGVKITCSQVL